MESRENGKPQKQPYERPRLRAIELAAEEVLAKGCKTVQGIAPGGFLPPCATQGCFQVGS